MQPKRGQEGHLQGKIRTSYPSVCLEKKSKLTGPQHILPVGVHILVSSNSGKVLPYLQSLISILAPPTPFVLNNELFSFSCPNGAPTDAKEYGLNQCLFEKDLLNPSFPLHAAWESPFSFQLCRNRSCPHFLDILKTVSRLTFSSGLRVGL